MNELPKYLARSVAVKTGCDYSARRFTRLPYAAEPTIFVWREIVKYGYVTRVGWIWAHYKCFANEGVNREERFSKFRMPALNER